MAIDPVCGMTVDEKSAAAKRVHEGRTYYFCSAQCGTKFEADPSGYLNKSGAITPPDQGDAKEPKNIPYSIWGTLTFITCPCCIPIWIFLLSGTAVGALLSKNIYLTVAVFLLPFLFFGWKALRSYNRDNSAH